MEPKLCYDCKHYENGWCVYPMPPWVGTAFRNSAGFVFNRIEIAGRCEHYEGKENDARPQEG